MGKIEVLLTPVWKEERIAAAEVQIIMECPAVKADDLIFAFHKNTVGVAFLDFSENVLLEDAMGNLEYTASEKQIPKILMEEYKINRKSEGDVKISYIVRLKPVGKNPAFDLGYEDGGMSGSGMSFMPSFGDAQFQYVVDWNLEKLPTGYRGIWSLGEGRTETVRDGRVLAESFYYAGNIKGCEENGCGFYWLENPKLPAEEAGTFVKKLFGKMAVFFQDTNEPYNVFSRKVPEVLTGRNKMGGIALTRSFLYLYPLENPPGEKELKFLFPHEMVHNWPRLKDEPFGACTWYVEGTAEYYSMILTDRYGMLEREELIHQLNKRAKDYYENPRIQVTNQFAGEHLFMDQEATLVPYGRGFFYLLHMEEVIRKATEGKRSLDDVVLAILKRTRAGEECGNEVWLEEVQRIAGIDISEEFTEMQNGKVFPPVVSALTTPVTVIQTTGIRRETGEECVLYQFR